MCGQNFNNIQNLQKTFNLKQELSILDQITKFLKLNFLFCSASISLLLLCSVGYTCNSFSKDYFCSA